MGSTTLNKVKESIAKSADDVIKQIRTMNEEDDKTIKDGSGDGDVADDTENLSKKAKKAKQREEQIKKSRQEKLDKDLENADYPILKKNKVRTGLADRVVDGTIALTKQYNYLPIEKPNFLEDVKFVGMDYDEEEDDDDDDDDNDEE